MLFQDVFRHTIYFLAEAERTAALNERLRREVTVSEYAGKAMESSPRLILRKHAALQSIRNHAGEDGRRE